MGGFPKVWHTRLFVVGLSGKPALEDVNCESGKGNEHGTRWHSPAFLGDSVGKRPNECESQSIDQYDSDSGAFAERVAEGGDIKYGSAIPDGTNYDFHRHRKPANGKRQSFMPLRFARYQKLIERPPH
jgi:hypothetical protein